ncbi:MAG: type II toxin-antitoxin system RelE/ParE family toxin [Gemmobacter sp.]|nr:type II toxin-antitoxin system RelE/ParE family toxin [Gemmobacter sp.]
MPRLIWSPAALRDVERLYKLLADENPDAARRAARSIREGMNILCDQPGAGRPIEDMEPEFREWLITFGDSGSVSLHRFDGETAVALAVRHQREAGY